MSTFMIQIQPNPNCTPTQPALFSPQNLTVKDGDVIGWANGDSQAHWPAPSASNPTGWSQFQTPAGATSDNLAVGPNPAAYTPDPNNPGSFTVNSTILAQPYTLNYVCANHPAETGQITVNPAQ
ncbi:MAG: hypothetical protein ACKVZH_05180 [Blastocatellia bacterium]